MAKLLLNDFEEAVVENIAFNEFSMNVETGLVNVGICSEEDRQFIQNTLEELFDEADFEFVINREDFVRVQFVVPIDLECEPVDLSPMWWEERFEGLL